MPTEAILRSLSIVAASDLSAKQYYFMDLNSVGKLVVAGSGGDAIGVLQNKPNAADVAGNVAVDGKTIVVLGGTIAPGDYVMSSAGKAVKATSGSFGLGRCLEGGVLNDFGSILLQRAAGRF